MASANHILLRRITLSASASSVTFDSIPQTGYTDLKVVMSARSDSGETTGTIYFNSDTTNTNYTARRLLGEGTSGASSASTNNPYFFYMNPSTATSNVYANIEFYIPNYTSSNQKSISIDGVTENNGGYAIAHLGAGIWTGTAAISNMIVRPYTAGGASFVAGSSFSLYGIADVNTTPLTAPKADGGDIIKTDGTYWYHAFLSSGTFKPQLNLTCDYLVVAAGGGSGGAASTGGGGGGGAGGVRSTLTSTGGGGSLESALALTANTSYTVTIGAGGTGGTANAASNATAGGNSVFASITSAGGGRGATCFSTAGGLNGGSGGGGGSNSSPNHLGGSASPSGQGYGGGYGDPTGYGGAGGGGGAGAVGTNAYGSYPSPQPQGSGSGGNGIWTALTDALAVGQLSSSHYYIGGGGGGGFNQSGGIEGSAGIGGGGAGQEAVGADGTPNTGGGAGGGGYNGTNRNGGNGGSGLVIVRYPV